MREYKETLHPKNNSSKFKFNTHKKGDSSLKKYFLIKRPWIQLSTKQSTKQNGTVVLQTNIGNNI